MRLGSVALVLGLCVACGDDGDSDTDASTAGPSGPARVERDCAPDDGGAFELTLDLLEASCEGEIGDVDLRIEVYNALPDGPTTVTFTSANGAVFYTPAGASDRVEGEHSGTITFDVWDATAIEGSYHLDLGDGSSLEGTFVAPPLCDDGVECG